MYLELLINFVHEHNGVGCNDLITSLWYEQTCVNYSFRLGHSEMYDMYW